MRNSESCRTCKSKKSLFQASVYQSVPRASSQSENADATAFAEKPSAFAAFKMRACWKNISVEPGGILDFSENALMTSESIARIAPGQYRLSDPGSYLAILQVHLLHPSQLIFSIDGEEQLESVLGTSVENTLLHGFYPFCTDHADAVLSVCNSVQNTRSLVVASYAGGGLPVTSDLMIFKLS